LQQSTCSKWKVNSLNAKMQSYRSEFVESQSAPVQEVLQAEMMCLSSYNAYQPQPLNMKQWIVTNLTGVVAQEVQGLTNPNHQ